MNSKRHPTRKTHAETFLGGCFLFLRHKWSQVGWVVEVRRENGDFGAKRVKLKCLPGSLFLSNHDNFSEIFRDTDSCY